MDNKNPLPGSLIALILILILLTAVLILLYSQGIFRFQQFEVYISAFSVLGTLILVLVTAITVTQNQNLIREEQKKTKRDEIKNNILEGEIAQNYDVLRTLIQESSKNGIPSLEDKIDMGYSHEIDSEVSNQVVPKLTLLKRRIEYYRLQRKHLRENLVNFLLDKSVFPVFENRSQAEEKVDRFLLRIEDENSINSTLQEKISDMYSFNKRKDLESMRLAINIESDYALDSLKKAEKEIGSAYGIPIRENKEINWDDWGDF